jgi:hypothetical protein
VDSSPKLIPLHTRSYDVVAFRRDATTFVLRGEVRDVKPPGLYIRDDPDDLTIHHMVLELGIRVPDLVIVDATARMETHPQPTCPDVMPKYEQIVGLSIARGFNAKIRELFGGPLGCTHTTALLQAMAPVAIQCTWSMNLYDRLEVAELGRPQVFDETTRASVIRSSLNTCHIWAEGGEHHVDVRDAGIVRLALPMQRRLLDLGRDPTDRPSA